ncbi:MAG: hypothetical protein JSV65_15845 [Armatimonadota bacterium]|nr:MAG: hypothetical protein JSV65_15845 [Armatimonadota bacterium]
MRSTFDPDGVSIEHILVGVDFMRPGKQLGLGLSVIRVLIPGKIHVFMGYPRSAFEHVYVLEGGKAVKEITDLRALVGDVEIRSPEMALRYVRLQTSPATGYTFARPLLEVAPLSAVDDAFVFGRQEVAERIRLVDANDRHRSHGVLLDEEWHDNALRGPELERTSQGFTVRRILYGFEGGLPYEYTAWRTVESVSTDGRVRRKRLQQLPIKGVALAMHHEA